MINNVDKYLIMCVRYGLQIVLTVEMKMKMKLCHDK